jgi:hypothetical protein
MGQFSYGLETGVWISFSVSGGLTGDGQWVQTWNDSVGQPTPTQDCTTQCPFYGSYASNGQGFVDDPAEGNQFVTWVAQTSYVQPGASGAVFTINWGYTNSNGTITYNQPALTAPGAFQQQQVSAANLWLNP